MGTACVSSDNDEGRKEERKERRERKETNRIRLNVVDYLRGGWEVPKMFM
jgi:hypothetical protein